MTTFMVLIVAGITIWAGIALINGWGSAEGDFGNYSNPYRRFTLSHLSYDMYFRWAGSRHRRAKRRSERIARNRKRWNTRRR